MWCSTPPSLRRASLDVAYGAPEARDEVTAESAEEEGRAPCSEDEGEAASFATAAASEVCRFRARAAAPRRRAAVAARREMGARGQSVAAKQLHPQLLALKKGAGQALGRFWKYPLGSEI